MTWLLVTVPGYLLGSLVPDPKTWGIDLVMPIIFAVMLIPLWKGKQAALPWLVAAIVSIVVMQMVEGYAFIVVGALAGAIAQVCEQRQVPLVINIAAAPQITEQGYKYLVRNFQTGGQLVTKGLRLIKEISAATKVEFKSAVFVHANDTFGTAHARRHGHDLTQCSSQIPRPWANAAGASIGGGGGSVQCGEGGCCARRAPTPPDLHRDSWATRASCQARHT
jgi:hypothetical protein